MLRGVSQLQIHVEDMPGMASFYGGLLGFRQLPNPEGVSDSFWRCFSTGNVELALVGHPQHVSAALRPPDRTVCIVLRVADMEAAREVLAARGVALSDVRAAMPGVQVCELRDPEDNLLLLEARD